MGYLLIHLLVCLPCVPGLSVSSISLVQHRPARMLTPARSLAHRACIGSVLLSGITRLYVRVCVGVVNNGM